MYKECAICRVMFSWGEWSHPSKKDLNPKSEKKLEAIQHILGVEGSENVEFAALNTPRRKNALKRVQYIILRMNKKFVRSVI